MNDVEPVEIRPSARPQARPVPLVLGIVLALMGVPLLVAGLGLGWALGTQRDADGFFTTPARELTTETVALSSTVLELGRAGEDDWWADNDVATVRVRASSESPVFLGIGPSDDVRAWLDAAAYDELTDVTADPFDYTLTRRGEGGSLTGAPGDQEIWIAQVSGPGEQTLEWDVTGGSWTVVIMNTDGSPGVTADVSAGGRLGMLVPLAWTLGLLGVALAAAGAVLIVWGASPPDPAAPGRRKVTTVDDGRASPVTVTGMQDASLSRWLWLVKWFLAIPHFIVLAVLWTAFVVLTFVAFVAILVTGRYPRSLFDLNVGILRWSWRVQFYATNAIGTDRYPPFSLAPSPAYPADLDIAYPEQLSRGLVLVKSWLLAIPHLIVVSVLAGAWQLGSDEGAQVTVGGLIGALTLAAGLVLLVTGRYPTPLFDLLVGLNRWVYRVIAYVALMTDDYPPFRLDQGPAEPAPAPAPSGTGWPAGSAAEPHAQEAHQP
ncbi:hypothetical protein GCM10009623_22000 [Nocardioides aestuarii]|uniref:DUF4389 domain-containing protein n=1 Tax=Nocardioides aestuarii TaxID=252231 RepID=A0ABW4TNK7_9ACTN